MDEQPLQEEAPQNPDWKTHFTTVTPLSKYLAMALFIALPFVGFWVGMQFSPSSEDEVQQIQSGEQTGENIEEKNPALGEDVNGDGVWDDVEVAILEHYSANTELQQVQLFGAKSVQAALQAGEDGDLEDVRSAAKIADIWTGCLLDIQFRDNLPGNYAQNEVSTLSSYVINKKERIEADEKFQNKLVHIVVPIGESAVADCLRKPEVDITDWVQLDVESLRMSFQVPSSLVVNFNSGFQGMEGIAGATIATLNSTTSTAHTGAPFQGCNYYIGVESKNSAEDLDSWIAGKTFAPSETFQPKSLVVGEAIETESIDSLTEGRVTTNYIYTDVAVLVFSVVNINAPDDTCETTLDQIIQSINLTNS